MRALRNFSFMCNFLLYINTVQQPPFPRAVREPPLHPTYVARTRSARPYGIFFPQPIIISLSHHKRYEISQGGTAVEL